MSHRYCLRVGSNVTVCFVSLETVAWRCRFSSCGNDLINGRVPTVVGSYRFGSN